MTIHVLGANDPRDTLTEVLLVELDYGKGGIVDSGRISIETSVEHLFQGWLRRLLQLDEKAGPELLGSDINAFREAQKILTELAQRNSMLFFPYYISTMPGFVLLDIEHGSFKKLVRIGLMLVVLPISTQVTGDLLSHRLLDHKPPVSSCVVVPTENSLREFVSYLGTLQNDIDKKPHALDTYRSLLSLYAELAQVPNGKLMVSVLLKGQVTSTFELTSEQARHDVPLLVEKVVTYTNKR